MKIITKFHPKDIQLSNTICCKGRIFGSISKDSVGMESYLARLFATLGVVMLAPTLEYAREKDYRRVVDKKFKVNIKAQTSRVISPTAGGLQDGTRPENEVVRIPVGDTHGDCITGI
jgi:hypothetical protein